MMCRILRARNNLFEALTRLLPRRVTDFLKICRMQFLHPFQIVVGVPGSFFPFLTSTNKEQQLEDLRSGLDATSLQTLEIFMRRLDGFAHDVESYAFMSISDSFLPRHQREALRKWEQSFPQLVDQYRFPPALMSAESFLEHHGLPLLPSRCRDYITSRDFLDLGAFIGDSTLVFMQYQPKKVYAFDASRKSGRAFRRIMHKNNIADDRVEFIPMGVSDKSGTVSFEDQGSVATSLSAKGTTQVAVTTVDTFVETRQLHVGLIKMDIEGMGLQAVHGMAETLRLHRPVLTFGVYHCPDELLLIKPFIESLDLGYRFMLRELNPKCWFMETTLLAYPGELNDANR